MHRLLVFAAVGFASLVVSGSAVAWSWPADGDVLRPFALGGDAYAAGQHRGIDVAGPEGTPVRAPASGTVTFAGSLPTYGRGVTILTADGYAVTLVHLGSIGVAKGDVVSEGAPIGTMGSSGEAEHPAPSVHLGVRVGTQAEGYVDPLGLLPPRSAPSAPPPPAPSPVAASAAVPAPAATATAVQAPPAALPARPTAPPPVAATVPGAPVPSATAPQAGAVIGAVPAPASGAAAADVASRGTDGTTLAQAGTGESAAQEAPPTPFRVDPRAGASPSATRTTMPRADDATRVVETSTRTRGTQRSVVAEAATAAMGRPAAVAPEPLDTVRTARGPLVGTTRAAEGPHRRVRVSPGGAGHPTAGSVGPTVAVSASSVLPVRETVDVRTAAAAPRLEHGSSTPGVLVAVALLVLLATAAAARVARRIGRDGAVLRHHADLLRQLHAAHRARLHDRGGGRVRTPSTAARP